ncbi:MAG: hypothetical protein ACXW3M_13390, partial [Rhodoplanes sp.]
MEAQPPDEEHDDVVIADAVLASQGDAGGLGRGRIGCKRVAVDAERDDRQLDRAARGVAETLFEIRSPLNQHALHRCADDSGGADERVPGLHGRDQQRADQIHDA